MHRRPAEGQQSEGTERRSSQRNGADRVHVPGVPSPAAQLCSAGEARTHPRDAKAAALGAHHSGGVGGGLAAAPGRAWQLADCAHKGLRQGDVRSLPQEGKKAIYTHEIVFKWLSTSPNLLLQFVMDMHSLLILFFCRLLCCCIILRTLYNPFHTSHRSSRWWTLTPSQPTRRKSTWRRPPRQHGRQLQVTSEGT